MPVTMYDKVDDIRRRCPSAGPNVGRLESSARADRRSTETRRPVCRTTRRRCAQSSYTTDKPVVLRLCVMYCERITSMILIVILNLANKQNVSTKNTMELTVALHTRTRREKEKNADAAFSTTTQETATRLSVFTPRVCVSRAVECGKKPNG